MPRSPFETPIPTFLIDFLPSRKTDQEKKLERKRRRWQRAESVGRMKPTSKGV